MIKVNLLKNRAIIGSEASNAAAKSNNNVVGGTGKAGFSKLGFAKKTTNLDSGFDTFECSPLAQFLKLILLVGFIVPLVGYEKMRAQSGKVEISAKNRELKSYQTIKFDKDRALTAFNGLEKKRSELQIRETELLEIKNRRLTVLYGVDELQTAVPSDVWLTSIVVSDNGQMLIEGQTLLDSGLDRLDKALKASSYFNRVQVQKDVKRKGQDGQTLNEFRVIALVSARERGEQQVEGENGR